MKLLAWAVLIFAVVWVLRSKQRSKQRNRQARHSEHSAQMQSGAVKEELMLRCTHCHIHFPASEAVLTAPDQVFCSEEHRRQHDA